MLAEFNLQSDPGKVVTIWLSCRSLLSLVGNDVFSAITCELMEVMLYVQLSGQCSRHSPVKLEDG